MKTLGILFSRNWIGVLGSLGGTLAGAANGGRWIWCFIVPLALFVFMALLDLSLCKILKRPIE